MSCRRHAADVEQFARDHADIVQVIGVGTQDSLDEAHEFIADTGLTDLAMVWQPNSEIWRLNNIGVNSSIQLWTHDMSQSSTVLSFNDAGRTSVLDASVQPPYAPT